MRRDTLEILRCPYCGGRVGLVESSHHHADASGIADGILGCNCCVFPVVDGIPVMHLEPAAKSAYRAIEAGDPALARRLLFGLDDDRGAKRFDAAAAKDDATYRELVEALGPNFEGGYFLYRFSDPTYRVAEAVVGALAATVLREGGRAVDLCGGSGHVTRLLGAFTPVPVLADLSYSKLWLARRFTVPGCEPVCCDGNAPLPFARAAFRLAVCSDAFMYIWTKRQFVAEMLRVIDDRGTAAVTHVHSANQWNPSAGMTLPPEAYRELFETVPARLFSEAALLDQIVEDGAVDLGARHARDTVDADPALTIVASTREDVFARRALPDPTTAVGRWRLNPLYTTEREGDRVRLRLRLPSADYAAEYGACRRYLPDEAIVAAAAIDALGSPVLPDALRDLARRRVVLDLPDRYC